MKPVVACLVLAVAVAGCGSSEPGWQDELREQIRSDFNSPEFGVDPADMMATCIGFGEVTDEQMQELRIGALANFNYLFNDPELEEPTIDELLAEYGIERTPAISGEVVDIYFDEMERACP